MFGRTGVACVLAASAFWLSACDRAYQSKKSSPAETKAVSPAGVQQITVHVPGMIDRQGIT
jgi:hypothetical protein